MSPTDALAALGWSERELARQLRRPVSTVRRWTDGSARMPEAIREWLARLAEAHAANPPPQRTGY